MQPFMGIFGVVAILLPKCPNPAVYGTAARLARATLRAWVAPLQPTSMASAWSSCASLRSIRCVRNWLSAPLHTISWKSSNPLSLARTGKVRRRTDTSLPWLATRARRVCRIASGRASDEREGGGGRPRRQRLLRQLAAVVVPQLRDQRLVFRQGSREDDLAVDLVARSIALPPRVTFPIQIRLHVEAALAQSSVRPRQTSQTSRKESPRVRRGAPPGSPASRQGRQRDHLPVVLAAAHRSLQDRPGRRARRRDPTCAEGRVADGPAEATGWKAALRPFPAGPDHRPGDQRL